MITEAQKQKMLECLNGGNFCRDTSCIDCPLKDSEYDDHCARDTLKERVLDIETKPTKKLCPHCKQEWKQ